MAKTNQESKSTDSNNAKAIGISKIDIGSVKNGRETSQAPPRPVKPTPPKK